MRDGEAALAAVAFAFGADGCDPTRSMATNNCADPLLCPRVRMVSFPQMAYSNSAGTVVGEVCSSLSPAGTHCLAPQLFISNHREDVAVGLRRLCPCAPLIPMVSMRSRWSYTCNFVMRMVATFRESHNKKSESISD
jgi:hypothetical protein